MDATENDSRYLLQSAANTLTVLEIIAQNPESGINEIVDLSGIGKSTVFRILYTLESRNYITRMETGRYRLGLKLFSLGKIVEKDCGIIQLAHPYLERLSNEAEETAHISIWKDRLNIVFIDKVVSTNTSLQMGSYIGYSRPAHLTASGKVLLSVCSDERIQEYINETEFTRLTDTTISSGNALFAEIQKIREQGYAVDNEESEIGLVCMADLIYDSFRQPYAAISISGPAPRMWQNHERNLAALKRIAHEVSEKL